MKLVKISMELIIDDEISDNYDMIADYLNDKLYTDPEFFGDFGPENIDMVKELVQHECQSPIIVVDYRHHSYRYDLYSIILFRKD